MSTQVIRNQGQSEKLARKARKVWAGQDLYSPDRTLRSDAGSHTSRKQNVVLSEVSSGRVERSVNFQGGKEFQARTIIS